MFDLICAGLFDIFGSMETEAAINALAALAQETRLAIFRLLVQAGPGGCAAGEIAAALGVPAPTLSFHLKQLGAAGLVTNQRVGRSIVYAVSFDRMQALIGFLLEDCCRGLNAPCVESPACLACD